MNLGQIQPSSRLCKLRIGIDLCEETFDIDNKQPECFFKDDLKLAYFHRSVQDFVHFFDDGQDVKHILVNFDSLTLLNLRIKIGLTWSCSLKQLLPVVL